MQQQKVSAIHKLTIAPSAELVTETPLCMTSCTRTDFTECFLNGSQALGLTKTSPLGDFAHNSTRFQKMFFFYMQQQFNFLHIVFPISDQGQQVKMLEEPSEMLFYCFQCKCWETFSAVLQMEALQGRVRSLKHAQLILNKSML